jgi:Fur family ferric uptake transcriptional regulator
MQVMDRKRPRQIADDVRASFRAYLHEHRIKYTAARSKILDAVLTIGGHFEAEQVLEHLCKSDKPVGKATVYRTLPLLVDCGVLKQVRFDANRAHYEVAFGEQPHDHMVCRRCGRIVEFDADEVVSLRERIAHRHQFHVVSHFLQLSGLCRDCSADCPLADTTLAGGPGGRADDCDE